MSLALPAALGLALTAALWWAFFDTADDERAAAAAAALAAWPVAVAVDAAAGIALLTAMIAAALVTEQATVKA